MKQGQKEKETRLAKPRVQIIESIGSWWNIGMSRVSGSGKLSSKTGGVEQKYIMR